MFQSHRKNRPLHLSAGTAAATLLALAIMRCSPVAPSVDKSLLRGEKSATLNLPSPRPEPRLLELVTIRKQVGDAVDAGSASDAAPLRTHILELSSAEVAEFRTSQRVEVSLAAEQLVATIRLHRISPADFKQFNITLTEVQKGLWRLAIAEDVPQEVSKRVRANVDEISFSYQAPVPEVSASPALPEESHYERQ